MKTEIIINLKVEGIHSWPECPYPEVDYLRFAHRHVFHIEAAKEVLHNDRDVEIIIFAASVRRVLQIMYWDNYLNLHNFGRMSCEDISQKLCDHFNLSYCKVLEDGEHGARVTRGG